MFLNIFVVALPMLIYKFITGTKIVKMFIPYPIYGDETGYYRVTKSFVEAATLFGNYGVTYGNDVAANYGGFSAHGPKYIVLYGILGKLFGWETYSILVYNILILAVGLAIFLYLVKLNNKQLVCMTVLMISFFPMLYFFVSGMVETLHFAFILVFIGLFYRFYQSRMFKWYAITFLYIFFLTFFRINYFVLYIPLIALYRGKNIRRLIIDGTIALIFSAFSYVFIGQFSAPYPSYLDSIVNSLKAFDFVSMFRIVFTHAKEQLIFWLFSPELTAFERVFKYCYLIVMALFVIIGSVKVKRERKFNFLIYGAVIMLLELLIVIFLYEFEIFRGFRTLSVFLFIPFLCVILTEKKMAYILCSVLFVVNLGVSSGYKSYVEYANGQYSSTPAVTRQTEIDELFSYIPCSNEGDRWKNTMAISNRLTYDLNVMFGFPGYIGLNYILSEDFSQISECEYILADTEQIEESINKEIYGKIYESGFGVLYQKK